MVRRTSREISRSKKSDPGWKAPKWHRTNWVLPGPHRNGLLLRLSRARGQHTDALPLFGYGHLDRRAASLLLPDSPKPFRRVALMTKRPPGAAAAPSGPGTGRSAHTAYQPYEMGATSPRQETNHCC